MSLIFFFVIILFASTLQAGTGFGFSIMATPFLLMLFPPKEAIQINLILSLVISIGLLYKIRNDIDFSMVKRLVTGSLVGLPFGIIILLMVEMTTLKLGVSVIILLLTIFLLLKFRFKQTLLRDYVAGGLSGLLTTSIGMPGPPLLLYFSGTNMPKASLRGTTLAFYMIVYVSSLFLQIVFVGTTKEIWLSSSIALPFVVIGLIIGQFVFKKINEEMFRIITYIILLFTGIYLFINTWIS